MMVLGFFFRLDTSGLVGDIGTVVVVFEIFVSDFTETMCVQITGTQTLPYHGQQATWVASCFSHRIPPFQQFVSRN